MDYSDKLLCACGLIKYADSNVEDVRPGVGAALGAVPFFGPSLDALYTASKTRDHGQGMSAWLTGHGAQTLGAIAGGSTIPIPVLGSLLGRSAGGALSGYGLAHLSNAITRENNKKNNFINNLVDRLDTGSRYSLDPGQMAFLGSLPISGATMTGAAAAKATGSTLTGLGHYLGTSAGQALGGLITGGPAAIAGAIGGSMMGGPLGGIAGGVGGGTLAGLLGSMAGGSIATSAMTSLHNRKTRREDTPMRDLNRKIKDLANYLVSKND